MRKEVLILMFPPFASSWAKVWCGNVGAMYADCAEEVDVKVDTKKRLWCERCMPNWLSTRKRKEREWSEAPELNRGWRDNVIRLGHYHIFDATPQLICLRWWWGFGEEGEAFTPHVNNEEVLVVVLMGCILCWTLLKMELEKRGQRHVNLEKGAVKEK
ncbi:hypothetical protein HBH89_096580 [Parastagonospora nodorum]|nr:hypothetical protein HBH89_096580 [Parastagonospora nodorum]